MIESRCKKKFAAGKTAIIAKACYQDPELVELLASGGVDGIWICLEHKHISPDTLYSLIQACRLGHADAIIRIKPTSYTDIIHILEAGACGIMLPRVRHPDEIREVVEMIKFPPEGRRGCDIIHADADFGRGDTTDYFSNANRELMLVVQIEEPEVMPYIDEIASIPAVDVLFVGPGDLSLGFGNYGAIDAPAIVSVTREVAEVCSRYGKIAGIPCAPEEAAKFHAMGYRFFNVFSDYRGVAAGLQQAMTVVRKL